MTTILTRAGKAAALTGTEYDTNLKKGAQTKSGNYTVVGSDNRDTIEVTASATITLTAAATLAAEDTGDFEVTIKNLHTAEITVVRSSTDTIDGLTTYPIPPKASATFKLNQAGNGFNIVTPSDKSTKYKTADTARDTTATLADDTHLAGWILVPDTVYKITGQIFFLTNSTADIKFGMRSSQTPQFGYWGTNASALMTIGTIGTTPDEVSFQVGAVDFGMLISGTIHTHATLSTTLDFQWSQNTSDGGSTTLYKGSWITIERLGVA